MIFADLPPYVEMTQCEEVVLQGPKHGFTVIDMGDGQITFTAPVRVEGNVMLRGSQKPPKRRPGKPVADRPRRPVQAVKKDDRGRPASGNPIGLPSVLR